MEVKLVRTEVFKTTYETTLPIDVALYQKFLKYLTNDLWKSPITFDEFLYVVTEKEELLSLDRRTPQNVQHLKSLIDVTYDWVREALGDIEAVEVDDKFTDSYDSYVIKK